MDKNRQIRIFDRQAAQYEHKKEPPAMRQWRAKLLREATGDVLELAVGAGANFPYYPPGVRVTAADFSAEMLKRAEQAAARSGTDVRLIRSDIERMTFPDGSFDTIVSTLSFCSYDDPLALLRKLQSWLRPGGKVLMMEHGISSNPLLALAQRALDPLLYRWIGCHYNVRLAELLDQAGLRVLAAERHWLGMIYLVRAQPPDPGAFR
ncbi:class I SAM-dependent methyltransferase [Paenibacillaceae bacterium WGS1546]|uniref:class I SAM-dependent methyltransferase n=1 Tax=Cohnella sp. WGS1546 TaxID=3366810 RepID=UPI00372D46FE